MTIDFVQVISTTIVCTAIFAIGSYIYFKFFDMNDYCTECGVWIEQEKKCKFCRSKEDKK